MEYRSLINYFHETTILESIAITNKGLNTPIDTKINAEASYFDVDISAIVEEPLEEGSKDYGIIKSITVRISDSEDVELASLRVLISFRLDNSQNLIKVFENKFIIDDVYSEWLDNVVLATTRGIMYSEFKGTFLKNVIFPLIKPSDLNEG